MVRGFLAEARTGTSWSARSGILRSLRRPVGGPRPNEPTAAPRTPQRHRNGVGRRIECMEDPDMPNPIPTALAVVPDPASRRSAMRRRTLVLCAALLAAGGTRAGDFSLGAGLAVSHGKGRCVDSFACDRSSFGGKAFGGYRVDDAWDVEAVYFGGHDFKGGDTTPLGTE